MTACSPGLFKNDNSCVCVMWLVSQSDITQNSGFGTQQRLCVGDASWLVSCLSLQTVPGHSSCVLWEYMPGFHWPDAQDVLNHLRKDGNASIYVRSRYSSSCLKQLGRWSYFISVLCGLESLNGIPPRIHRLSSTSFGGYLRRGRNFSKFIVGKWNQ